MKNDVARYPMYPIPLDPSRVINIWDGVSGSCQVLDLNTASWGMNASGSANDPYASPGDYYQVPSEEVKMLVCGHCDQRHRIDESKLDAIAVLDCLKCGASLI